MDLAPRRFADTLVLAPAGRIDHASAETFHAALAGYLSACGAGRDKLVLDLSGLEYISSAGLRILILAAKQCKAQGGTLLLAGLRPLVQEIFDIGRFTLVFDIAPSLREALARASSAALTGFEAS
jgi:anti-anti-sigma factor